jgi:hypothetical protein
MNILNVKLASIIVHLEEYLSPDGHPHDRLALLSLLEDPDVERFVLSIDPVMLPIKRNVGKKS